MYSRLKNKLGGTGIALVAVLALVIASIAVPATAKPVASISASVTKQVKQALGLAKKANKSATQAKRLAAAANKKSGQPGPAGPTGKAGNDGAQGPQGPQGPAGLQGPAGPAGDDGASVSGEPIAPSATCPAGGVAYTVGDDTSNVCNGQDGEQGQPGPPGANGSPWTAGGTLPAGATQTGTFYLPPSAVPSPIPWAYVPISFTIPLPEALPGTSVHMIDVGGEPTANCPGSVTDPEAAPNRLCFYFGHKVDIGVLQGLNGGVLRPSAELTVGTDTAGALLTLTVLQNGGTARGTWAVSGPPVE